MVRGLVPIGGRRAAIWRWLVVLLLLPGLLGSWLPQPRPARAASIEVTSTLDDDGAGCTLREAIASANTDTAVGECAAGSGDDTITFAAGLTGPIVLAQGQLTIATSLTIAGPGRDLLTIDGAEAGRIFVALDGNLGDDVAVRVALAGLTITGGVEELGGGIYAEYIHLDLRDLTITGNRAAAGPAPAIVGGRGGGLYAQYLNALTLTRVTVSDNVAEGPTNESTNDATYAGDGGGLLVYASSGVVLTDSVISGNTAGGSRANQAAGGRGGGIMLQDLVGAVAITGTTISGNSAAGGTGLASWDGAYGQGGRGGGLYASYATVTLSGGRIAGNTAGGGTFTTCCTFQGGRGGGLYAEYADVTLLGVTVGEGNVAGGGTNKYDADGGRGGGIYATSTRLELVNAIVQGNRALAGTGIYSVGGGAGGGIYLDLGRLGVTGGRVAQNRAEGSGTGANGQGGGIYAATGQLTLTTTTLTGNIAGGTAGTDKAGAGKGGGLYFALRSCTTPSLVAALGEPLPGARTAGSLITGSTISDNVAAGSDSGDYGNIGGSGGGIFLDPSCTDTTLGIVNTTLDGNRAAAGAGDQPYGGLGGGLYVDYDESGVPIAVSGTTFANNRAEIGAVTALPFGQGGGAYLDSETTVTLVNSTFAANSAEGGGGALAVRDRANVAVTNVTVAGNTAGAGGGQIAAIAPVDLTLTNTIVAGGGAAGNCAGPIGDGGGNLDDAATCAFSAAGSRANTDPLLGPLADNGGPTRTLLPQPGSPAIDGGSNFACPTLDQRGTVRPQGASCDIGAVELLRVEPILTSLEPNAAPQGSATFTLTVTGADFVAGLSAIRFGDTILPTTFVSPSQLTAEIPAAQLASARTVGVTVTTSGPGGGTSNSLPFTVVAPSPSPSPGTTFTVTVSREGSGTVSPGTGTYAAGTVGSFAATAGEGQVFLGWTLDGRYVGFASPLDFSVNGDRTLVATFAPRPVFGDVPVTDADWRAITFLAALGIVNPNGVNGSGAFEPGREVKRAEVAAFIARTFGWNAEFHRNNFPDRCDPAGGACIDDELWNNVAALADYGVVGGYTDPATCASAGTTAPCYLPRDPVLRVQVASIVARAFTKTPDLRPTGFWDRLPADPAQYTNVPNEGTQRSDLTTYRANAGPIPGQAADSTFPDPQDAASRRFVIAILWQAFSAQFGVDRVP